MTGNEYQRLAARTTNPALKPRDTLINGVMGLCGEAGEAIDIVKKHVAQGHELDREALIKELGDVAWYLAETATALGVDLDEILERNIEKLRKRYPEGFSAEEVAKPRRGRHLASARAPGQIWRMGRRAGGIFATKGRTQRRPALSCKGRRRSAGPRRRQKSPAVELGGRRPERGRAGTSSRLKSCASRPSRPLKRSWHGQSGACLSWTRTRTMPRRRASRLLLHRAWLPRLRYFQSVETPRGVPTSSFPSAHRHRRHRRSRSRYFPAVFAQRLPHMRAQRFVGLKQQDFQAVCILVCQRLDRQALPPVHRVHNLRLCKARLERIHLAKGLGAAEVYIRQKPRPSGAVDALYAKLLCIGRVQKIKHVIAQKLQRHQPTRHPVGDRGHPHTPPLTATGENT